MEDHIGVLDVWDEHGRWVRCKGLEMLQCVFETLESIISIICEPIEDISQDMVSHTIL